MLTAVMLLLLPVIFAMSVWRTYTVPRDLVSRRLGFSPKRPMFASITFVLIYCALLVNTLAVVYACSGLVWHPPSSFDEFIPRLFPAAAYPFVYLSFEWTLYHAVKTAPSA